MKKLLLFFSFASRLCWGCLDEHEMQDFMDFLQTGSQENSSVVTQALAAFEKQSFQLSIDLFNQILDADLSDTSPVDIGTSLWGSLLCSAILDHEDLFEERLKQAHAFFIDRPILKSSTKTIHYNESSYTIQLVDWRSRPNNERKPDPVAKFANPNEKISIGTCIDRVKGVSNALKFGIAFVKKGHYAFILNAFVDALQERCMSCCESGTFWTTCVSPILVKLDKWKLLGIPDDPAWD